jgi:hypothetical protein
MSHAVLLSVNKPPIPFFGCYHYIQYLCHFKRTGRAAFIQKQEEETEKITATTN